MPLSLKPSRPLLLNPGDRHLDGLACLAEDPRPLSITLAFIAAAVAGLMLWYFVQLIHVSMGRGAALRAEQQQAVTAELERWHQPAASVEGMVVQPPPPAGTAVRVAVRRLIDRQLPAADDERAWADDGEHDVSRPNAHREADIRSVSDNYATRSDTVHAPVAAVAAFNTPARADEFAGIDAAAATSDDRVMALSR